MNPTDFLADDYLSLLLCPRRQMIYMTSKGRLKQLSSEFFTMRYETLLRYKVLIIMKIDKGV
jgi:hypothetical protein